jgi:hypothetical protein
MTPSRYELIKQEKYQAIIDAFLNMMWFEQRKEFKVRNPCLPVEAPTVSRTRCPLPTWIWVHASAFMYVCMCTRMSPGKGGPRIRVQAFRDPALPVAQKAGGSQEA